MSVSAHSPFKAPPRISRAHFIRVLTEVGSPWALQAGDLYDLIVRKEHDPAIWLAICAREHTYGTNRQSVLWRNDTRSWTNARSVRHPGITGWRVIRDAVRGSDYVQYADVIDSLLDGMYRVTDPTYRYVREGRTTIAQVLAIWTEDPGEYLTFVLNLMNAWGATDAHAPAPTRRTIHVALSAGHWNTAGGNHDERVTVRPLAFEVARQLRAHGGFHVTMMTPESGNFPGDHNAVARAVMALHATHPVDLFLECHTEGTTNPANRGSFGVTPYWPKDRPDDRDGDAEVIAADLARRLRGATDIPVKTTNVIAPGVMAEYQTGVGQQGAGSRLGVFANTAAARATMTRLIFEYGAHSNPQDFAIQRQPWFTERAARATVEAVASFYRVAAPSDEPVMPDPNAWHDPETGQWVVNDHGQPILDFYRERGGWEVLGRPMEGMHLDDDGVYRQLMENVLIESWPNGWGPYPGPHVRIGGLGQRYSAALAAVGELCECLDEVDEVAA